MPEPKFIAPMSPLPSLLPYARQAKVNGREIFYFDTDPSQEKPLQPPCLLVHGLGDEADTWEGVISALAARADPRRVIALDLPGFGRSELPVQPVSIPGYVDTLLALLDHLKIPQATLVGHSLGAILVQTLALEHPERAASLLLISGGLATGKARLNLDLVLFLIPGIGEWNYKRLRRDSQSAYKTLYPYYFNLDALPQEQRDFLFQRVNQRVWSDKQRQAFLAALRGLVSWLPGQQKTLAARLAACPVPTHIFWGAKDQITSVESAHLLASLYPAERKPQVTILPQAGHNLHQEYPQEIII